MDKDIILYGSARSGTTWVANVIAGNKLKLIFEPLHPINSLGLPASFPLEFLRSQDSSQYESHYLKALSGQIQNNWTMNANLNAKRSIIKVIRANLMIEWIQERFDYFPLFIIRNPLSVVASTKKQKWLDGVTSVKEIINISPSLLNILGEFTEEIESSKTDIEIITLAWCIENKIPQIQGYFEKICFIEYKDLIQNPFSSYEKIFKILNISQHANMNALIHQRSFTSEPSTLKNNYKFEESWKEYLNNKEVDSIVKMVSKFKLDKFLILLFFVFQHSFVWSMY